MPISSELVDNFRVNVGRYFDGHVACAQPVTIRLQADGILIRPTRGSAVLWDIADTHLVRRYSPGEWFTLCHDASGSARLHLPPRMYDRLVEQYGNPMQPSVLQTARSWILPGSLFVVWLAILVFLVTPWTGKLLAAWHSHDMLVQAGQQKFDSHIAQLSRAKRSSPRFCAEPHGLRALAQLSDILAALPGQTFRPNFVVVQNNEPNAYSLGAGYAVLSSALIDFVRNETELMGVMAHEMGHGEARHSVRREIEGVALLTIGNLLFRTTAGSYGYMLTGTGLRDPFRRQEMEREADRFAIRQLRQAELDPAALGELMQRLAERRGGDLGIFDNHPTYAERTALFAAAAQPGVSILSSGEWQALKTICRTTTKTAPVSLPGPSS